MLISMRVSDRLGLLSEWRSPLTAQKLSDFELKELICDHTSSGSSPGLNTIHLLRSKLLNWKPYSPVKCKTGSTISTMKLEQEQLARNDVTSRPTVCSKALYGGLL